VRDSPRAIGWFALASLLATAARAQDVPSEESTAFFRRNCASCHTIGGGRLTGPDLKGVFERRDREKVVRFILDPAGEIQGGDPYVRRLVEESRGAIMPPVPGMTRDLASKLADLVVYESKLEKSRFAGTLVSDRPLTPFDVALGAEYFVGRRRFKTGGPPCNGCHTLQDLGGLGGGELGPDLTAAYARLDGRKALANWLASPPGAVMQPAFASHPLDGDEILALVAYMKETAESGAPSPQPPSLEFVVWSIGGVAALLTLMDFAWRRRFTGVRRALVWKDRS
jgi:mono/diheme cytochrome c family protein